MLGPRLWMSVESAAALLKLWIRFLLQSPALGYAACPVRCRRSRASGFLMRFSELSLTGEYSCISSSLETGLKEAERIS